MVMTRTRERAVACAHFDNGSVGARDGYHSDVDGTAMVQKVLAELSPASGRCPQPGE